MKRLAIAAVVLSCGIALAIDPGDLALIPFPKEIALEPGELSARISEADASSAKAEVRAGDYRIAIARPTDADPPPENAEGYSLRVSAGGVSIRSTGAVGAFYGIQTLKQLIRGGVIPCLRIRDWPSLRWRGFADDITRGPSTLPAYLQREVDLAAESKQNFLSYYMEHQFAFTKHPKIGPKDGSLSAAELRALVEFANPNHVEIIGNQQSFGHFGHILKHPEYARLRENADIISPAFTESYALLDDMLGEPIAALQAEFFNVCCDETWGLGTGPTKERAQKEGVGRIYADHIRKLHEIVRGKYKKRMMMWGDIILQHPEELPRLPKDIIMLTWAYDPRANFEGQIVPFAKSGFEFFVCPGVSCWGRLVPDVQTAETNIRNFVRDGLKHGALGMLNTTWDDSGENLNGWNAVGILWGAECAWSGATTEPADFARRVGPVLFGETEGLLARVIAAIKQIYLLPGTGGMGDGAMWSYEAPRAVASIARERAGIAEHLKICRAGEEAAEAIVRLGKRGKHEAESLHWAMRRLTHIAKRRDALLRLGDAASPVAAKAEEWEGLAAECVALRDEYAGLWLAENRPYHLDVVKGKFDALTARYRETAKGLREKGAPEFKILEIGARIREAEVDERLTAGGRWEHELYPRRAVIVVRGNARTRVDLPVEIAWRGEAVGFAPRLFHGNRESIAVGRKKRGGTETIAFIVPGEIPADGERRFVLNFGRPETGTVSLLGLPEARVEVKEEGPARLIDTGPIQAVLAPEGAHLYTWKVKALGGRDVTMPGESDWHGFLDTGWTSRAARYEIETKSWGWLYSEFVCRAPNEPEKTITFWSGQSWVEVFLDRGVTYFWNFDDVDLAGDGPTPGIALFSDGTRTEVGSARGGAESQRARDGVVWSAKVREGDRLLAMITPETPARHVVGPGGGWGGVGIEASPPALHFIVVADRAPADVKQMLDTLASTLTLDPPPRIIRGPTEERKQDAR